MNPAATSFVLGYHGCDHEVAERIFAGQATIETSHNDYDWLGDGIYFWEFNAQRAYEFAVEVSTKPRNPRQKIDGAAVIGAIIDVGFCLNLLDSRFISMVREGYFELLQLCREAGTEPPQNKGGTGLLHRKLDCAVLRTVHQIRESAGQAPFDTVRSAFFEGDALYPDAGFSAKNHIQICVRHSQCIKGYFRPLDPAGKPLRFGR